jgi:AraC family transcriptional regulator of adaptative response/methylated-DNA-[protein]-cysteine methyltransferase
MEILRGRREANVPLEDLARLVGMSPFHLHRTFRRMVGVTPREYAHARRAARLRSRLRKGDTVTEAVYSAGYGSASRAHEDMKKRLGIAPATYRRRGEGMAIEFTTVASPLGRLLVGRTERGICSIALGESDAKLERRLRREFPSAAIRRGPRELGRTVREVLRRLDGKAPATTLPLDFRGTAFQMRVWEALRKIPRGATRTYGEVAAAIGRPTAVRAVARACATNRVPIVVPCHRVVRGDGALGGYALGVERKRRLLARERARPVGLSRGARES